MKTKYMTLILAGVLSCANAVDIGDLTKGFKDSILGKLDKQFDGLFSEGLNFLESCYGIEMDTNFDNTDFCSIASEVDNLKVNVCGLFGGKGTKN